MKFFSVCSGIDAASVAWKPCGFEPCGFSEIDPFCNALLKNHYPDVVNYGDMNRFRDWGIEDGLVRILVGGTPCQSFSVQGLRRGMDDPRGNLALVFLAMVDVLRPRWVVWENVPGVLSSGDGRDFGSFLGGLAQLGYGFAYRVLDAQHVRVDGFRRAVPQRRRRVFVVGHLGDWRRSAAVLFDRESLHGVDPPQRSHGQDVAGTLTSSLGRSRGGGVNPSTVVAFTCKDHGQDAQNDVAPTLRSMNHVDGNQNAGGQLAICIHADATARDGINEAPCPDAEGVMRIRNAGLGVNEDGSAYTLAAGSVHSVAYPYTLAVRGRGGSPTLEYRDDGAANAIQTNCGGRGGVGVGAVAYPETAARRWIVRRLTPLECERLQGFPDGYTAVPYRGKPAKDGPRYTALGNSIAVNALRWIGRRIELVERLDRESRL